jgi:hypothetical protein
MYTGSTSGVNKPSLINRMYVHWTPPTPPGPFGSGGIQPGFGSGGIQPGLQDHLDCINATRQLFTDLYLLVKSPQEFTKDAKGGAGSNRDAVRVSGIPLRLQRAHHLCRGDASHLHGSLFEANHRTNDTMASGWNVCLYSRSFC